MYNSKKTKQLNIELFLIINTSNMKLFQLNDQKKS